MAQKRIRKTQNFYLADDLESIRKIAEALSNPFRLQILKFIGRKAKTISEISQGIGIPTSNVLFHIDILDKVNLIQVNYSNKHTVVAILTTYVNFDLIFPERKIKQKELLEKEDYVYEIPLGNYINFENSKVINVFGVKGPLHLTESNIFDSSRFEAGLITASDGFVSYPLKPIDSDVSEITFSLELSAECPFYKNNFQSDITFYLGKKELFTVTLSGDYGNRRGILNPSWLDRQNSQYGNLYTITIQKEGIYLNGDLVNKIINIDNVGVKNVANPYFKLGNKSNAINIGGFNIFGQGFGDHPQNIKVIYRYKD